MLPPSECSAEPSGGLKVVVGLSHWWGQRPASTGCWSWLGSFDCSRRLARRNGQRPPRRAVARVNRAREGARSTSAGAAVPLEVTATPHPEKTQLAWPRKLSPVD